jgi:hypothetical protein
MAAGLSTLRLGDASYTTRVCWTNGLPNTPAIPLPSIGVNVVEFVNANAEMAALRAAIRNSTTDLARFLCAAPNRHMSNWREWRFGQRGSLSIVVAGTKVGTWYDDERNKGVTRSI